jgi:hypothetical protein
LTVRMVWEQNNLTKEMVPNICLRTFLMLI